MIKHIVMWKLLKEAEGATKSVNAQKMKQMLESLKHSIPEIITIEVGLNIERSETAYDVVLYSEFDNEQALQVYQEHPDHQEVASFVRRVVQNRAVVDYIVE